MLHMKFSIKVHCSSDGYMACVCECQAPAEQIVCHFAIAAIRSIPSHTTTTNLTQRRVLFRTSLVRVKIEHKGDCEPLVGYYTNKDV